MPTGRKPKPTKLKLITGNPGCRPLNLNEPQPRAQLPKPPDELNEDARIEWQRIVGELHRIGLLTVVDRAALSAYCQAWGRWIVAERELRGQPLTVEGSNGNAIINPLVRVADAALTSMIRCCAEFGMTPASRSRIRGGATVDTTNPFAGLGNDAA